MPSRRAGNILINSRLAASPHPSISHRAGFWLLVAGCFLLLSLICLLVRRQGKRNSDYLRQMNFSIAMEDADFKHGMVKMAKRLW